MYHKNEALELQKDAKNKKIVVVSDLPSEKERSQETFRNKEILKRNQFEWGSKYGYNAWIIDDVNYQAAKKVISDINKKDFIIERYEDLKEYISESNLSGSNLLKAKIDTYIQDLANIVDETALSAEISRYFTFFSKFTKHSFYNCLLIWLQDPEATKVAGYVQWTKNFNRGVKKNPKAIQILAPIFQSKSTQTDDIENEDNRNSSPISYRTVLVYDIRFTYALNGKDDIPETPAWYEELEADEKSIVLYDKLIELCGILGIKVEIENSKGGERGYSIGGKIALMSDKKDIGTIKTLVHEIAHELLHQKNKSIFDDNKRPSRRQEELQAESVAYVVMKHLGYEMTKSATYLALWKANKETILSNIKIITMVSNFIINELDKI
jgi:hypothetical protein